MDQIKSFTVIIVLENHFQTDQIIQETNHLKTLTTEDDHQTKELHVISHKVDKIDQIVGTASIEITIHDQTQIDQNIQLIIILIQILGINTIQTIDQETHRRKT